MIAIANTIAPSSSTEPGRLNTKIEKYVKIAASDARPKRPSTTVASSQMHRRNNFPPAAEPLEQPVACRAWLRCRLCLPRRDSHLIPKADRMSSPRGSPRKQTIPPAVQPAIPRACRRPIWARRWQQHFAMTRTATHITRILDNSCISVSKLQLK